MALKGREGTGRISWDPEDSTILLSHGPDFKLTIF